MPWPSSTTSTALQTVSSRVRPWVMVIDALRGRQPLGMSGAIDAWDPEACDYLRCDHDRRCGEERCLHRCFGCVVEPLDGTLDGGLDGGVYDCFEVFGEPFGHGAALAQLRPQRLQRLAHPDRLGGPVPVNGRGCHDR